MAEEDEDDLTVWRIELEVIASPERAEELHERIRALVADEELESLTRFAMDMRPGRAWSARGRGRGPRGGRRGAREAVEAETNGEPDDVAPR